MTPVINILDFKLLLLSSSHDTLYVHKKQLSLEHVFCCSLHTNSISVDLTFYTQKKKIFFKLLLILEFFVKLVQ